MNFIGYILVGFIWWILLLPLFMLIATPFILLLSIKGEGPYYRKVRARYSRVIDFWEENAWAMTPWKMQPTRGSRLRPTSCRYAIAFARYNRIPYCPWAVAWTLTFNKWGVIPKTSTPVQRCSDSVKKWVITPVLHPQIAQNTSK